MELDTVDNVEVKEKEGTERIERPERPERPADAIGVRKTEPGKSRLRNNRIIRSIKGNKLVIDCDTMNYRLHMLESNKIRGLLPLEITENDGVKKLCYDITSREAFGGLGTSRTLKMEDVKTLIYGLNRILSNLENYLLIPDDLVLDKDYIYVQNGDLDPRLCYLPGYEVDFATGLSTLLQDVLGMVDHNDHDAVVLAYSLYQESLKPGYVMADLIKILNNAQSEKKSDNPKQNGQNSDGEMYHGENGEAYGDKNNNGVREKTTDELFVQYQVPAMDKNQKLTPEEKDSIFNAVSKPTRRKHGTLFSR